MANTKGTNALPEIIQKGNAPLDQAIASLQVGTPEEARAEATAHRVGLRINPADVNR